MKANLKEILESIPDHEDFMKLAGEIGQLSFEKMRLENQIKAEEVYAMQEMTKNIMQATGKAPSVSYVESMYKYTGVNNELVAERERLAEISAQLEQKKIQLSIYRDMIGLFQTVSANERGSGF